jgi:hypothetical protein
LALGSRFATYGLVLRDGDPVYSVPWARDASASFLLTESETRTDWFKTVMAAQGQSGPNLGLVMGPDFQAMTSNLARNLRENRLGVVSAVLIRD